LQQGGLPVEIERLEGWERGAPDALAFPEYFDGIAFKRVIAYFIDALIILAIMGGVWIVFSILTAMSLGLLAPLLWPGLPLVPLLYHTLTIGADDSATYGMRLLGVTVRTWDGRKPGYLQAALNTMVFYASVGLTGWLILVVALFNDRRRTLHDFLCGTVVINAVPWTLSRVPEA
jgi:uncharacterized RDD family membrane protein YckC